MHKKLNSPLMPTYNRLKVAFESGSGAWLTDTRGERYLDALSGISVCSLGHAHPAVAAALADQAGRLIHTSNLYEIPLQEQLAQRLCGLSGLDKVFFGNSGAEANEAAIKICRKYAHEQGMDDPVIVVMEGSFHGRTLATVTATGNAKLKKGFGPLLEGFHHIPYGDIAALRKLTGLNIKIVAVMLEPILGEGGIVIPPRGYLREVAEVCRENNWLLVLDEIQTGMCRTGAWFAFQHEGIRPDIVTLAKALGNGVPIGACLTNDMAAAAMVAGTHGSTFGGNPLACRAGLAVLDYMQANAIPQRAAQLGQHMLSGFQAGLAGVAGVKEVRGKGMMFGIELEHDCTELAGLALQRHLLINITAGNVIRLLPPLIISDELGDQIVAAVCSLVVDYLSG
jgi:acetylornithine aminotransferase